MRIGIVAERRIKTLNPFERYKKEWINSEKNPFELIIATIPYSIAGLDKTSPKRVKKAVFKAAKMLKASGADKILFSTFLSEYSDISTDSKNLALSGIIPDCIRTVAPKCGIFPPDCKICIRADKMDRITEYLATELCYDTKKLVLCISDNHGATDFQERFFNETGSLAEISCKVPPDAEILIDLTDSTVRIGRDILIDGVELDLDMGGCSVNFLDVAACIGKDYTAKKISSYIMGKKKLTL